MNAAHPLFRLAVERPVLALAFNLLLCAVGLFAALSLPLREHPDVDPPVVTVLTNHPGASAEAVEREVTRPVEDALAGVRGARLVRAQSRDETSVVAVEFRAGARLADAAAEVRDQLARVRGRLPRGAEEPVVLRASANDDPVLYVTLSSARRGTAELTDIAERVLLDALGAAEGVAAVEIRGGSRYAMRISLRGAELAARGLAPADVAARLRAENLEVPAGRLDAGEREIALRARTRLGDAEDFRRLVLREGENGAGRVLLGDVAGVAVGAENERTSARLDGQPAVALAVLRQAGASALAVSAAVRAELARLRPALPEDVRAEAGSDEAVFVRAALANLAWAVALSALAVGLVALLFLGSWRAALVPAAAIPAALLPAAAALWAFGGSLNTLTLLAAVLAVGLCVDDAVVVAENARRRQRALGETAPVAAARGASEVGFAVVATTAVLLAVVLPLAFLGGFVGRLLAEFAVALAAALVFSTLAAATLGPALTARALAAETGQSRWERWSERAQAALEARFRAALARALERPSRALGAALLLALAGLAAALLAPREFAPDEDRGLVVLRADGPEGAGYAYTLRQVEALERALAPEVGPGKPVREILALVAPGQRAQPETHRAFLVLTLAPWGERGGPTQSEVAARVARLAQDVPGARVVVAGSGKLGRAGGGGRALELAVVGADREAVVAGATALHEALRAHRLFDAPDLSHRPTRPQVELEVDRDRAASLGLDAASVGEALRAMFGGLEATRWLHRGREYPVILQAAAEDRAEPGAALDAVFLRARGGALVPLSSLLAAREVGAPRELRRVDRLASVEIGAGLPPGVALGDAAGAAARIAEEVLPQGVRLRPLGEALAREEAGASLLLALLLALALAHLVLAMQFESFAQPALVLVAAPLALAGGALALPLFGLSLNLFTQVALVLLVGMAAKNGVLLVEFANRLLREGRAADAREAALEAAALRLRPVLMTTLATALGALPLALASGAGAEAQRAVGLVLALGLVLGTAVTLFAVPVLYAALGARQRQACAPPPGTAASSSTATTEPSRRTSAEASGNSA